MDAGCASSAALADEWDVELFDDGKVVWFELHWKDKPDHEIRATPRDIALLHPEAAPPDHAGRTPPDPTGTRGGVPHDAPTCGVHVHRGGQARIERARAKATHLPARRTSSPYGRPFMRPWSTPTITHESSASSSTA